ncbi:alpha carbonic anhydrase [Mycena epipterygia]|nr:alpha carbonic anhydrase [Mycena epipterygia]
MLRAIFVLVLTPSFLSVAANCLYGTSFFPRSDDVVVGNFSYSGVRGPLAWAGLNSANCACRTGKRQSPIVLNAAIPKATSAPQLKIPSVKSAVVTNLETTLDVSLPGKMIFGDTVFQLKQFYLHTPSEHRINEEYFPLDMHMVHQAGLNGSIVVVAILFKLREDGSTSKLLASVARNVANAATPGTSAMTGPLDFTGVAKTIATRPLFQYSGSFTTTPCTETRRSSSWPRRWRSMSRRTIS